MPVCRIKPPPLCGNTLQCFVKTNLLRSNTTVGLRDDSPYSRFKHATQLLQHNELDAGLSGWGATEPQAFAVRLAKVMLSSHPPRHYQDGWLWWAFYYLGCYAPLWVTNLMHRVRLQLFGFLQQ